VRTSPLRVNCIKDLQIVHQRVALAFSHSYLEIRVEWECVLRREIVEHPIAPFTNDNEIGRILVADFNDNVLICRIHKLGVSVSICKCVKTCSHNYGILSAVTKWISLKDNGKLKIILKWLHIARNKISF